VHLDAGSVVPGVRWDLVGVPASMKKQVVPAASEAGQVVRDEHVLSLVS